MDPEDTSLQMHLLEHTPSAGAEITYRLLFDSLRAKDFRGFKSLIEQAYKRHPPTIDVNHVFSNRSEETLLDTACKSGLPEFVDLLLGKGANPNRVNEIHNRAPIHFATESGKEEVLRRLLNDPLINPNLEAGQQTALHIAVRKNDLRCAELLLESGASANIPNSKGITALHLAASKSQEAMVKTILRKTRQWIDLDSYKDYNNLTTREVLQKKLPDIALPPPRKRSVNVHDLKYYLNANDEANFLKSLKDMNIGTLKTVLEELLELAAQRGFVSVVTELLAKVPEADSRDLSKAAKAALQEGRHEILRELLNVQPGLANDLILPACLELGMPDKRRTSNFERLECLKMILDRDGVDVRCVDGKGNTPLHYAARAGNHEAVTLLLRKGSYIGQMNKFNVPPLADIPLDALTGHLDDCLRARHERTEEYVIEFDYICLKPHDPPFDKDKSQSGRREMEALEYISENKNLKHLLKHPLLSSFLYLKWHRIRHIFYINFIFYAIFYILLNTYILNMNYSKIVEENAKKIDKNVSNDDQEAVIASTWRYNTLWTATAIGLLFLFMRELFQLISSPSHYLSSLENWLEMTLIALGLALLGNAGPQVGAVAILLSAWELVILIGQHPRMSTGIEMFKTVSLNFMRFLFLYAFLILAFALAFFTLFKDGGDENFPDPGRSLFKTIIMLTGEFDASDIPFVSQPILSHFVFVLFVFLIAIVLFNLLNGLAVNDTADILGKAELIGLIARIRLVAYVEKLGLGSCWDPMKFSKWNPLKFLTKRILLFPEFLKDGKLLVSRSYHRNHSTKWHASLCSICKDSNVDNCIVKIDPEIFKRAKYIVTHKGQLSENEKLIQELDQINQRLFIFEVTLKTLERAMQNNNLNSSVENEA